MKWPWARQVKKTSRAGSAFAVRGFAAAQTDRLLSGWQWDGGFTAMDIRSQLPAIRSKSRELAKNNPHMRRFLQLVAINLVGDGFSLKSMPHDGVPGSDSYRLDVMASRFIEYHFRRWATHRDPATNRTWADASGRKTLTEIDQLNVKTWARDGEYIMIPMDADNPYGFTVRVIRPDALDHTYFREAKPGMNPVFCGVEIDRTLGFPIAYYFHSLNPESQYRGKHGPLIRISAHRVIHGFTAEDEDQPRGIPWAHASMTKMKMIEEYDKAEITAARDEACSVRSYHAPSDDPEGLADLTQPENAAVAAALVAEKEPGQSEILPPGWAENIHTPQHPNRELTAFKSAMHKDVASGLGVEYSNAFNDWAGVSFSSVRVGTISERDNWTMLQNQYIAQSKSPIFLMWLRSFLSMAASGNFPIEKYDKFSEHEFRGRRWMWVDPQRDMNAAKMAVDNGWKTNTDVASDLGYDYDDNLDTIKREKESRARLGLADPTQAKVAIGATVKPEDDDEDEK